MNRALRRRTVEVLELGRQDDRLSRCVDLALILLICGNVLAIILESMPSMYRRYHQPFYWFEMASVAIFTVEYLLRVWSVVDRDDPRFRHPVWGRLRYMVTPIAVIDLLAVLPSYLAMFMGADLRFLRVVRVFRIFKLTRYSAAMHIVLSVLREEASSFFAAFFVLLILLIVVSSGMYLIEQDVQPEAFGSIPDAMWWAMSTLTTVGYGDVTPITPMGKFFGGCITIIGMGMVALPAGILASGFSDQLRRRRQEYNIMLDKVLEDGVISNSEQEQLQLLQRKLDLDTEEADLLLRTALSHLKPMTQCPHCQKEISPKITPVPPPG